MPRHSIVCEGEITTSSSGAPICSSGWIVSTSESFDPSMLDPATCAQVFGVGFVSVVPVLLAIAGIRALIQLVKEG